MKPTIDTLLDLAEKHARLILTVLHQDLMPSWVIVTTDGTAIIRGTPWRNDAEKHLAEVFIKGELTKHHASAFSFVSEAWVAGAPQDWDPGTPMPEADRPANRVDRREVVIAFASNGQDGEMRRWQIMRNWKGEVEHLQREATDDWTQLEGWIADLMKK